MIPLIRLQGHHGLNQNVFRVCRVPRLKVARFTLPYRIRTYHRPVHAEPRDFTMFAAKRLLLAAPMALMSLTAHAGDLSVVGTGDGIDLLRALGAAYTADHPETTVIVPPSIGSGGGIAAVGSNKEVLARAARPLTDPEKEAGLVATPV